MQDHRLAASEAEKVALENPGFYKFRKGGEPHATDPDVVEALQNGVTAAHALVKAVKGERFDLYGCWSRRPCPLLMLWTAPLPGR